MLKILLMTIGLISLSLGAIGIFLPILPTTPFLLLSAFCFARSSERLHAYLLNHRFLGEYISNYYNHTMTSAHKLRTLSVMWFGMILSCFLIGSTIPWIVLPLIATAVTVHIIRLKPRHDPGTTLEQDSTLVPHSVADHKA